MRRCVVIGANGQLGRALPLFFSTRHEVVASVRRNPRPGQVLIDLSDIPSITETLRKVSPDLILIAGAYANVDQCEQEPTLCRQVNVEGPLEVARYAREAGSFVVYYSTDHVFDGSKNSCTESDPVHPLNVYSRTKVEGEAVIRETVPGRHLILRTSWLYGPDPEERNFPLRCLQRLAAGERVPVPSDQWGSPTYTEDLANATRLLLDRDQTGTFHVTGPDFVNRYDYACRIAGRFEYPKDQLIPTPTAELGQVARRALAVKLDCGKFEELNGLPKRRGIMEGLSDLKRWRESSERTPHSASGRRKHL